DDALRSTRSSSPDRCPTARLSARSLERTSHHRVVDPSPSADTTRGRLRRAILRVRGASSLSPFESIPLLISIVSSGVAAAACACLFVHYRRRPPVTDDD